jgi:hypothetical protein
MGVESSLTIHRRTCSCEVDSRLYKRSKAILPVSWYLKAHSHDWHCLEPYKISPHLHIAFPSDPLIFFHPRLRLLHGLFPSIFPFKTHEFLISFRHATCPAYLICLDLVALILSGQDYKPCRPTYILCIFLNSPVTYVSFRWECSPHHRVREELKYGTKKSFLFLTFEVPVYKYCAVSNK